VYHNELVVHEVHIELDPRAAHVNRPLKRSKRVFGFIAACTAVTDASCSSHNIASPFYPGFLIKVADLGNESGKA
jgi:hypothetical protein